MSLAALNKPRGQQRSEELDWLRSQIVGAKAILEVGSCFGWTLRELASVCAPGAKIRSVDLGVLPDEAGSYAGKSVARELNATIDDLDRQGFDAAVWYGNSRDPIARQWAWGSAPYDLVFIDAEHSYEGVKADWENYGPMGTLIAFHDIAHEKHGVGRLWAEIKASGAATDEMVRSHMGIGIVRQ